ncbi:MAG: 2-hydroxyacid dehydrogenase [Anaerolineae bacterium]
MHQITFIDFVFENKEDIFLEGCQFAVYPPCTTAAEIINAVGRSEILLMRDQFGKVTAGVMDACPNLKLIVTRSAGHDHIDLAAARERGIVVCNVPDYGAHMIAEHAFGLMLAVARHTCVGNERYRRVRRFDDTGLGGVELFGKTLGVIGTGRIGRHSIRIGQGFGMQVVGFDAFPGDDLAADPNFAYLPLEELLAVADFVTLHVPLLDSTHHLINADTLALMKPGAILVNTSRGPVVDTAALQAALAAGRLRGAGLDVLEDERTVYHDFGAANVVITPHLGWYTEEARDRILRITLDNVSAWLAGKPVNRLA